MPQKLPPLKRKKPTKKRPYVLWFMWAFLVSSLLGGIYLMLTNPKKSAPHSVTRVALDLLKTTPADKPPYGLTHYQISGISNAQRAPLILIVDNMGLRRGLTEDAIKKLPKRTTFAFSPYTSDLKALMPKLHAQQHELLLELPLQPIDGEDKGPLMITADASPEKNLHRLENVLKTGTHFIGTVSSNRSLVIATEEDISPILNSLNQGGLIYVDGSLSARSLVDELSERNQIPIIQSHFLITKTMNPNLISSELAQVSNALRQGKPTILIVNLTPITLEALTTWLKNNKNTFTMQPLSMSLVLDKGRL